MRGSTTPGAVRYDDYGGVGILRVEDVAEPSWDQAGSLFVAGTTACAAAAAVGAQSGETVAVSAAAGGVGSVLVQLLV